MSKSPPNIVLIMADQLAPQRRDNMLINIGASQSLAVKSAHHTPVVLTTPVDFSETAGWDQI